MKVPYTLVAFLLLVIPASTFAQDAPPRFSGDVTLSYSQLECIDMPNVSCPAGLSQGSLNRVTGRIATQIGTSFGAQTDLAFGQTDWDSSTYDSTAFGLHTYWSAPGGAKLGAYYAKIHNETTFPFFSSSLDYRSFGLEALVPINTALLLEIAAGQSEEGNFMFDDYFFGTRYQVNKQWNLHGSFEQSSSEASTDRLVTVGAEWMVSGLGKPVFLGINVSRYLASSTDCHDANLATVSVRIPLGQSSNLFSPRRYPSGLGRTEGLSLCGA